MKKFVNRIDHVVWLSRLENLDKNIGEIDVPIIVRLQGTNAEPHK